MKVKRFVKTFLDFKGGKIEHSNIEDEVYRIFLPKQISLPLTIGTQVLEGSFNSDIAIKKGYTYLALGNPYIMNLVHHAVKPSVAILKHPSINGTLMIYKISVRDGKDKDRNGKIIAFNFDSSNGSVTQMDIRDIWSYQPSSHQMSSYDRSDFIKNKELIDVYADKYANDLLSETAPRLR